MNPKGLYALGFFGYATGFFETRWGILLAEKFLNAIEIFLRFERYN